MTATPHIEGTLSHKLDPKGRVAVPIEWRSMPLGSLRMMAAQTYGVDTLRFLSECFYRQQLDKIDSMKEELGAAKVLRAKGAFIRRCAPVKINEQGKLQVPKAQSVGVNIDFNSEVMLVGFGTYFEIYSLKNYDLMVAEEAKEITEFNDIIGGF